MNENKIAELKNNQKTADADDLQAELQKWKKLNSKLGDHAAYLQSLLRECKHENIRNT